MPSSAAKRGKSERDKNRGLLRDHAFNDFQFFPAVTLWETDVLESNVSIFRLDSTGDGLEVISRQITKLQIPIQVELLLKGIEGHVILARRTQDHLVSSRDTACFLPLLFDDVLLPVWECAHLSNLVISRLCMRCVTIRSAFHTARFLASTK